MKLTRQEEVALLFASELACHKDTYISLSEVADRHGISPLFLKKIAVFLKKHGIVKSREGQNGGYILSRDPDHISTWDVRSAVSGITFDPKQLPAGLRCPLQPSCLPQQIRLLITEAFRRYTSDVTIDQFVQCNKRII